MCIECGYIAKIYEILKDKELTNDEQLDQIFSLKEPYNTGIDLYFDN